MGSDIVQAPKMVLVAWSRTGAKRTPTEKLLGNAAMCLESPSIPVSAPRLRGRRKLSMAWFYIGGRSLLSRRNCFSNGIDPSKCEKSATIEIRLLIVDRVTSPVHSSVDSQLRRLNAL